MYYSQLALAAGISTALAAVVDRSEFYGGGQHVLGNPLASGIQCDIPSAIDPTGDGLPSSSELFDNHAALLKQVERHGTVVKIPTISYDDNGEPGEDPRWDVFYELHDTLAELYPSV
jgi:Gly-Xaa carboxypeptidase